MFELDEQKLTEIMEKHHEFKWGNRKKFIIERSEGIVDFNGECPKLKYLYRGENDADYYLSEDEIKTILCEWYRDYDVENIEFLTRTIPTGKTRKFEPKINDRGLPANQETMRYLRHPEMNQSIPVYMPVFEKVCVHVKEKNDLPKTL